MGERTAIAWTEKTWNPWQGCRKVSAGCAHCYMYSEKIRYGQRPNVVVPSKPATFNAPLKWKEPARIFTCSWSDWFIEEADGWRDEAWEIVRRTPHLTYQILTKRPGRIGAHLPGGWPYPNVWLGVSVENQEAADERIPYLLATPAAVRFLSCEPLLGPIDVRQYMPCLRCGGYGSVEVPGGGMACPSCYDWAQGNPTRGLPTLSWVIVGGESGPKARPMELAWARSLVEQCRGASVPVFVKQLGAAATDARNGLAGHALKVPDEAAPLVSRRLRDRKGGDPMEWPEDLRVREFPRPATTKETR